MQTVGWVAWYSAALGGTPKGSNYQSSSCRGIRESNGPAVWSPCVHIATGSLGIHDGQSTLHLKVYTISQQVKAGLDCSTGNFLVRLIWKC